jgi:hypothetical protein
MSVYSHRMRSFGNESIRNVNRPLKPTDRVPPHGNSHELPAALTTSFRPASAEDRFFFGDNRLRPPSDISSIGANVRRWPKQKGGFWARKARKSCRCGCQALL